MTGPESTGTRQPEPGTNEAEARSREVRLGLVMYGGVSLAIYIYGVGREFFDAVRGRGIFKLIKALTDSDIVVDVISGTSAGGINGILLAYCITNELEFAEAASIWRDRGGIRELLRDPVRDPSPKSVLRGDEYFLASLVQAFKGLASCKPAAQSSQGMEDPSPVSELDLFVTGTDVHGRIDRWFDAAGHTVDVKDHRTVFHLKHRAGRKEPLSTKTRSPEILYKALGKLARITSCFPAAFEPAQLSGHLGTDPHEDNLLSLWGWGPAGIERNAFFVDGGVLDNKPFTSTITEIFHRLAERNVARKLFYVEPAPERFAQMRHVDEPNLLKVVWGGLSGIPAYESTIDDLRALAEHNEQVARFHRLVQDRRTLAAIVLDDTTKEMVARFRAWEDQTKPRPRPAAPGTEGPETPSAYAQSRLVALSERVVYGVLRVDGRNRQLSDRERRVASKLLRAYDDWPGNGDFTLYSFDVDFRMRRLFGVLYACPDPPPADGAEAERLRLARYAFNRQTKLIEIVRSAMERALDEGNFGWEPPATEQADWEGLPPAAAAERWKEWAQRLWREEVATVFLFLLNVGPGADPLLPDGYDRDWAGGILGSGRLSQTQLSEINDRLLGRVARVKRHLQDRTLAEVRSSLATFESVLWHSDDCERRILEHVGAIEAMSPADRTPAGRTLHEEYDDFMRIDTQMFPLENLSGLHEQDIIDTVRVSPLDARRGFSDRPLDEKVSGDAVSHFGGFFKKSWRSNDILWGRLDGVCQLTETLLDPRRIEEVMRHPRLRQAVARRVAADLDPAKLFPESPKPTHAKLKSWLSDVTSDSDERRRDALQSDRFEDATELLIEAQQLEILQVEVPNVIEDAVSEQAEWRRFRVFGPARGGSNETVPAYDPAAGAFYQRSDGAHDRLVTTAAAETLARQAIEGIKKGTFGGDDGADRPRGTALGSFFRNKYRVGAESLTRDVPIVVLLEILSTALLVTRNCVVGLWGPRADAIRKNPLYRVVSAALWGFDGMVALLKHGAGQVVGVMAGLALLSVLALFVGVGWWSVIIQPAGQLKFRWLVAFIIAPAGVLILEIWLLSQVAWRTRRVTPRSGLSIGLLTLLAAGALAAAWYYGPRTIGLQGAVLHSPDQIRTMASEVREKLELSVMIDYGFLIAYSLALALAARHVARRLATKSSFLASLGRPIAWLALFGGAIDAIENSALMLLIRNADQPGLNAPLQTAAVVGGFCSDVKYFLPLLALAYCLIGWIRSTLGTAGEPQGAVASREAPSSPPVRPALAATRPERRSGR